MYGAIAIAGWDLEPETLLETVLKDKKVLYELPGGGIYVIRGRTDASMGVLVRISAIGEREWNISCFRYGR